MYLRTLPEVFDAQVAHLPSDIALVYNDHAVTYGELNHLAESLARLLVERGAVPGTLIGLYGERSIELVIGLLGILKSGAGYVPLDFNSPSEHISQVIADARPALILTTRTAVQPSGDTQNRPYVDT